MTKKINEREEKRRGETKDKQRKQIVKIISAKSAFCLSIGINLSFISNGANSSILLQLSNRFKYFEIQFMNVKVIKIIKHIKKNP